MNTPPYEYDLTILCDADDAAILRDALYFPSTITPSPSASGRALCLLRLDCDGEDIPLCLTIVALWARDSAIDGVARPHNSQLPLFVFTGAQGTFALGIYGESAILIESDEDTDPLRSRLARAVLDALAGEGGA